MVRRNTQNTAPRGARAHDALADVHAWMHDLDDGKKNPRQLICNKAHLVQLRRLVAHNEMVPVWKFLIAAGDYDLGFSHARLFAHAALIGLVGPRGDDERTPAELRKWKSDISEAARALASLIEGSRLDHLIIGVTPEHLSRVVPLGTSLSEALRDYASFVEHVRPRSTARAKKSEQQLAYFCRILGLFFRDHFPGARSGSYIHAAVYAAFGRDLDPTQVRRWRDNKAAETP